MKEVKKGSPPPPEPEAIIYASRASNEKYYGVVRGVDKGFICSDTYEGERDFRVRAFKGVTKGNLWRNTGTEGTFTLQRTIDWFLSGWGNSHVFEFNSWDELLRWAIKD